MKEIIDPSYYGMKAKNYDVSTIKQGRNGKKFIVAYKNNEKVWRPYVKKVHEYDECCVIL